LVGIIDGLNPSSPPAYDELFPNQESEEDHAVKKASAVQAAGDAAIDRHFEALDAKTATASSAQVGTLSGARASTSQAPQGVHRREIKQIQSDKNLFLIWIPLLVLVLGLMLRNAIPDVWHVVGDSQKYLSDLVGQRVVEVA